MTYKKFGIVAIVISALIVISCIVLCFIETNNEPLRFTSAPKTIYLYNHGTQATAVTEEDNSEKFNRIFANVKDMTSISIFTRFAQGGKIDELPSQDVDCEIGYYSNALKQENLCIELVFDQVQQQLIQIDGNEKVVEYYSMLFVVNEGGAHVVAVYLNQNTSNRVYTGLPMLVRADTTNLYNACLF